MTRRIAVISGSRADFHLMVPVYQALAASPALAPTLIATSAHLHPAFRASSAEALAGFPGPVLRAEMPVEDDSGLAMAKALGQGLQSVAEALRQTSPQLLLLQGDRGEMLAGAMAAAHMNIPVVHMSGGDRTGSIDNAIRNAVSAFAHVHLTTCALSSANLRAMGEDPQRIFEVGEPALDRILALDFPSRPELCARLGLAPGRLDGPFLAATLHPVTTEAHQAAGQMGQFLDALEALGLPVVVSAPNTDAGGQAMRRVLEERAASSAVLIFRESLGFELYMGLLRHAQALAGNSSSGILEAPSLGLPVVNVGQRQHGRLRAANVLDVGHGTGDILAGLRRAVGDEDFRAACRACVNPYGDGTAARRTAEILERLPLGQNLLDKWRALDGPLLPGPGHV